MALNVLIAVLIELILMKDRADADVNTLSKLFHISTIPIQWPFGILFGFCSSHCILPPRVYLLRTLES